MTQAPGFKNQVFFFILFAVLLVLGFWLVEPYIATVAFSLMVVIVLKPVFTVIDRWIGGRSGLAAALSILLFFVAVVVPLWLAVRVVNDQLANLVQSVQTTDGDFSAVVESIQSEIDSLLAGTPFAGQLQLSDETAEKVRDLLLSAGQWATGFLVNLGMSIPTLMANFFIFLAIVGGLLPNYHRFVRRMVELSPLENRVDWFYLTKIKAMIWAMLIGIVVIALAQGLVMGLFFWLGDVPLTAILTLLAIVASALPLGASLIAIPVGLIQLLLGDYVAAVIVLGGYLLVVSNIDSILRPRLVSKEAYLDAALVLLSALGGFELFGFFGVVYGPVLMVLLMTTIEVYSQYYSPSALAESVVVGADEMSPTADPATREREER